MTDADPTRPVRSSAVSGGQLFLLGLVLGLVSGALISAFVAPLLSSNPLPDFSNNPAVKANQGRTNPPVDDRDGRPIETPADPAKTDPAKSEPSKSDPAKPSPAPK